jgi:hypothetical protein
MACYRDSFNFTSLVAKLEYGKEFYVSVLH